MQTHGKVRQGNDVNNDKQTQAQPQFSPAQSGAVQVVLIGEEVLVSAVDLDATTEERRAACG